jgi:hypothetical protein
MKKYFSLFTFIWFSLIVAFLVISTSCNQTKKEITIEEVTKTNTLVEDNIKKYVFIWDQILNKGKLDTFIETNFTTDITLHVSPNKIVGIEDAKAMYANFLTGFSNIEFTINDIFGQGDKLVKYWTFKGTHTGEFFGIPASGNSINLQGATIIRMENGRIAEEQDFYDNLEFSQQLGLIPR